MITTREKIYRCIQRHIRENGCAPTCREISAEIGICLSTVHGHLIRMQKAGMIGMTSETVRGITIPEGACAGDCFRSRLEEARESSGLSREELARLTGISYHTVCCHEQGTRHPSTESLRRYSHVLNLAVAG